MMDLLNVDLEQVKKGKVKRSDKIEPLLGLNYRGVLDAATNVPVVGDVLSGGLAAYDLSQGDYGSAALNALGVLPFVSGTFIGKGAKTWDKVKEADAMSRLAKGEDAAKVWKDTGIGKAPWDKIARAEIPDNKAKIYTSNVSDPEQYADLYHEAQTRIDGVPLGNALFHPKAYEAYPQSQAIRFKVEGEKPSINGSFDPLRNQISITDPYAAKIGNGPENVTLHELQHAIQGREGWAKGGNPENAPQLNMELLDSIRREKKKLGIDPYRIQNNLSAGYHVPDEQKAALAKYNALNAQEDEILANRLDPYEAYSRLAGEAEARLTQHRMALTPQERLQQYPYDPAYFKQATGVDINDLIVRGGDGPSLSVNTPKLTEFEQRHLIAQRNAALPVEQGGLGLPPNNTAMDRARELEYDTPAFHSTPYDFNEFKPHHYRGASFFADTPEGAIRGSSAGNGEMQFIKVNPDHGGQVMPVLIGGKIHGDHNYPDWFIPDVKTYGEYRGYIDGKTPFPTPPVVGLNDAQLSHLNAMRINAMKQRGSIVEGVPESEWNKYPNVTMADGAIDTNPNFPVIKGVASSKDGFGRAPVDYKGFEGFGYDVWNPRSSITKEDYRDLINKIGFGASRVSDESGSAIAVMNPANIRSRFAAFDPMRRHEADLLGYADPRLLGAIAGGGLLGLGGYSLLDQ